VSAPVLVTGGTGFVGGAILAQLVESGQDVRALVRTSEGAERVLAAGARPVTGDILERETLAAAMAGCEIVYHAAGLNLMCLPRPGPLMRTNALGSVNVVRAAARAGVRRVVYTSTAATLDPGPPGQRDRDRDRFLSQYARSKSEAERLVCELAPSLGLELVCVNPASVQGPGRTGGTARWLISYANGRLHWMIDATVSLVDIADCARAHLLAAGRGEPLRRYVISGHTRRLSELVRILGEAAGTTQPLHFLPAKPALVGATLVGLPFRALGRRAPVCREMLRTLAHEHAYDGEPAARELGFSYTPLEDTMRRALAWYQERRLVRAA